MDHLLFSLGTGGVLLHVLLTVAFLGFTIYGLALAFQAVGCWGFLALLVQPLPFIVGVVMFFGHVNILARFAS